MDVFLPYRRFFAVSATSTVCLLVVCAGLVCGLIPGIYLVGRLAFAPLIVFKDGVGPVAGIKKSLNLLYGRNAWLMFVSLFICGVIGYVAGVLSCGILTFVTAALPWCALGIAYSYLCPYASAGSPPASPSESTNKILQVRDLEVSFGPVKILRGVSFDLEAGQTLGIVGESGCGKSMTGFAIMGMLQSSGKITAGSIKFEGRELTTLQPKDWLSIRGKEIALVMQDPFTSLNPMMRVGDQIAEALRIHQGFEGESAWSRSVQLLEDVGVPIPAASARKFPHQLSGGQRQRVVIAIAFACKPKVLIADEPTTALDVTLQAQILRLIRDMQEKEKTAVMLISHDVGVIGSLASRVAVFYAGRVVEMGPAEAVLRRPVHPYTQALLKALPKVGVKTLESIGGQPPRFDNLPKGCAFAPRCPVRDARAEEDPSLFEAEPGHYAACWRVLGPAPLGEMARKNAE
ncbi:MAG TPA: ABC transporter ATP-binding protein [Fimbriimonadaceae bacterium]